MTSNAPGYVPESFAVRRARIHVALASARQANAQTNYERGLRARDAAESIDFLQLLVNEAQGELSLAKLDLEEALSKEPAP
jgi:hypothetical protein